MRLVCFVRTPLPDLRQIGDPGKRVSQGMVVAWASGSYCQTLVIYAFGVLYFRYLTDTVGIAAALTGTLIAVSKLYDALINPMIGWLTDRVDTGMGRRRPWMLIGGVFMALALVQGFNIPVEASAGVRIGCAALGLFLFSTGYSLFAIPWLAMPPEISGVSHQRTQMMAWRVGFSSLSQGTGSVVGPMLLSAFGMGALAYGRMGLIMGALCLVAALSTVYATRNAPAHVTEQAERPALLRQVRMLAENRPFVILVMVKICLYFGLAIHSAAMALLTRWVLHVSDYWLGIVTLLTTLAVVGTQPLWLWCSRRFGNKGGLGIALAVHAGAQVSLAFNGGSVAVLLVQAIWLGAGAGGVFMLSQALLPDVIEHDYRRTGLRRGGAMAGVVALLETGASAISIFVMGLILSGAGYIEGKGAAIVQPDNAIWAIVLSASLVPALVEMLGIACLSRFRPDGDAGASQTFAS
jgi:GPH family glycoside/pentoside/hexuronide:cation symporter